MIPSALTVDDANAVKCELAGEVLRSSGTLRLRVSGWSMLPTVLPGDTLVIERIDRETAQEGDIVLFARDRRFFVHRVVSKPTERAIPDATLLTRGDAMPAADAPVAGGDLLGKVCYIIRNGRCIEPSRTLRLPQRAVAALAQRSLLAARVVVGVHSVRQCLQPASQI